MLGRKVCHLYRNAHEWQNKWLAKWRPNATRPQGNGEEQAAERHQRARERKSPSISAFVFALASTSPALRKPSTATKRPIEAVSPSLMDCGRERVTTSRRPKRVSRKNKILTSRQCPDQFASRCLHCPPALPPQPALSHQCRARQ